MKTQSEAKCENMANDKENFTDLDKLNLIKFDYVLYKFAWFPQVLHKKTFAWFSRKSCEFIQQLWWFVFSLDPIFSIAPAASKNDAHFKRGQKWLINNNIYLIVSIRGIFCFNQQISVSLCLSFSLSLSNTHTITQGSISSTFYLQLLRAKIPKA